MSNPFESSEFIADPSKLSLFIKDIAVKAEKKQVVKFYSQRFLKRKIKKISLSMQAQNYIPIYSYILNFKKHKLTNKAWENIETLVLKLEEVFEKISLNNISLSYWLNFNKNKPSEILTKDEQRINFLINFHKRRISAQDLKKTIGTFALNPFELSNPRLKEYSQSQIKILAQNAVDLKIPAKPTLREYINKHGKDRFSIYSAMREELKWLAMEITADLRINFLKIAKILIRRKIIEKQSDIFKFSFDEIKKFNK